MPRVCLRRPPNIDFIAIRQRQPHLDIVLAAGLMTVAGTFDDDPACRNATVELLELLHMVRDLLLNRGTGSHILEFNFNRRLHCSLLTEWRRRQTARPHEPER